MPMVVRCAIRQGCHLLPWRDDGTKEQVEAMTKRPDERMRRLPRKEFEHDLTAEVSVAIQEFGFTAYCYACGSFFRGHDYEGIPCRPLTDPREEPR